MRYYKDMKNTPETTNLKPMTISEALVVYNTNGKKPFSFMNAPYGVLKTVMIDGGHVVAAPPTAFHGR